MLIRNKILKKSLNLEVNSDSKSIIPNKSSTSYLAYKYLKLMEDRDLDNAKKNALTLV